MNARRLRGLAALSLLLTAAAPAPANPLSGLFGLFQGFGGSPSTPPPTVALPDRPLGLTVADDAEFPAFPGFRAHGLHEQPFPAMAGMVFRTHRHLIARQKKDPDATPLDVTRPLGEYAAGREKSQLQQLMIRDTLGATPMAVRPEVLDARGETDLFDVLLRRLETQTGLVGELGPQAIRELGFELRSLGGGARRRVVLLYRAERKVQEDGRYWWVLEMYDPHMTVDDPARLSQLRMKFAPDGALVVQARSAWARSAEDEAKAPMAAYGFTADDPHAGDWVALATSNLGVVDQHPMDQWAPEHAGGGVVDRAESLRDGLSLYLRPLAEERSCGGGGGACGVTIEEISDDAFDAAPELGFPGSRVD